MRFHFDRIQGYRTFVLDGEIGNAALHPRQRRYKRIRWAGFRQALQLPQCFWLRVRQWYVSIYFAEKTRTRPIRHEHVVLAIRPMFACSVQHVRAPVYCRQIWNSPEASFIECAQPAGRPAANCL